MNEGAIFEIGDVIHVRRGQKGWNPFHKLTAAEIVETYEFKMFEEQNPELVRLVKGDK